MAARLKIPLSNKVPPDVREVTDGQRVWFRRSDDPREEGEAIYHGIAHVILVREGWSHNEVDACNLAAELGFPAALALQVQDVARAQRLQPELPVKILEAQIRAVLSRAMAPNQGITQNRIRTG